MRQARNGLISHHSVQMSWWATHSLETGVSQRRLLACQHLSFPETLLGEAQLHVSDTDGVKEAKLDLLLVGMSLGSSSMFLHMATACSLGHTNTPSSASSMSHRLLFRTYPSSTALTEQGVRRRALLSESLLLILQYGELAHCFGLLWRGRGNRHCVDLR